MLHISPKNDFKLLHDIGGECAGAVSIYPEGCAPTYEKEELHWLSESELAGLLQTMPLRPLLAGKNGVRLSLAGAQNKLPVCYQHGKIAIPSGNEPSTHIIKPSIQGFSESVRNEFFCLSLAQAMGINTVNAQIITVAEQEILLVERYDRVSEADGSVTRLHQEDFCQALCCSPHQKYQSEGGPTIQDCFGVVRRYTRPSAKHTKTLLEACLFNMLVGNNDAHAKNFSLLYLPNRQIALAPLYDLLSIAAYSHVDTRMAMKIAKKSEFEALYDRHFLRFAEEIEITQAALRRELAYFCNKLPALVERVYNEKISSLGGSDICREIIMIIQSRCALVKERMGLK